MRHERINEARIAAAAWPTMLDGLVLSEPPAAETVTFEVETVTGPTPAAPDVPNVVGDLILTAYGGLLAVFFAFFSGSPLALFAICICTVFVTVFFAVPRIFFAVEPDSGRRPSFNTFLHEGIDTLTGRTGGRDALVQMLIVPVLLTFGLLAMGIIGAIYL
jgi:hypothetical protein